MPVIKCAATTTGVAALLGSLEEFYADGYNFGVLKLVNSSAAPISLRAIEWYVTDGQFLNAHARAAMDFATHVKTYTRKMFDPFRRNARMELRRGADAVLTTPGQMNFFRWLITSGQWTCVVKDRAVIHARMLSGTASKRRDACARADSGCSRDYVSTGLTFRSGSNILYFD